MNVDVVRKDGKLRLENLHCDCGFNHALPKMDIYIKRGLINNCAECISESDLGKKVLIVADSNTHTVAAAQISKSLQEDGFDCRMCVLPGEHIEPTPEMVKHIISNLNGDIEFILAVGSGVITDLTRRSAFLAHIPFAVFGTAASMDGYTSITSSMLEDGMKISRYGNAARLLMFDTVVLAEAPPLMNAAGVGDVLAKYNVLADWRLGRDVAGERYCPLCANLVEQALKICSGNIEEIACQSEAGAQALIESLILAGLTVLIVGSTRPVASYEHNMAHYFEMSKLAYGGCAPSHGISAGIGLVYALMLHEMLYNAEPSKADKSRIFADRLKRGEKRKLIINGYPQGVGKQVIRENKHWYISKRELKRRIDALADCHKQYKKDSTQMLPKHIDVVRIFKKLGAPAYAAQAGIDENRLKKALVCCKDYRQRYNIAFALDELGLLDKCIEQIIKAEKQIKRDES